MALAGGAPVDAVAQHDHLTDVWTSLFFGVGVIWTAIGMRGALVQALAPASPPGGGVEVLERMVDGGILLALSTTIFGGVGGYLMRVWKTLAVGAMLKRYYEREQRRDLTALRVSLSDIQRRAWPRPSCRRTSCGSSPSSRCAWSRSRRSWRAPARRRRRRNTKQRRRRRPQSSRDGRRRRTGLKRRPPRRLPILPPWRLRFPRRLPRQPQSQSRMPGPPRL